jgi:hypothetical protein
MHRQLIFPPGGCGHLLQWVLYLDSTYDPHVSVEEKTAHIVSQRYGDEKRWFNWVLKEYEMVTSPEGRTLMYKTHFLTHENIAKAEKSLIVNFSDVEPLYERSFIIRPSMWAKRDGYPYSLGWILDHWNTVLSEIEQTENIQILLGDSLFSGEQNLNIEFYQALVSFYGFENHYEHANKVYQQWMKCMDAATVDFCKLPNDPEFQAMLGRIKDRI